MTQELGVGKWEDWAHFQCNKICPLLSPPVGLLSCTLGEVHHEDPEARAFYLGPGLNLRSKQFARAHGIPIEELPPGGPPLAEMKSMPAPPTPLPISYHSD